MSTIPESKQMGSIWMWLWTELSFNQTPNIFEGVHSEIFGKLNLVKLVDMVTLQTILKMIQGEK